MEMKRGVQLNFFASEPRVHLEGSSARNFRRIAMSSSESRSGWGFSARRLGGKRVFGDGDDDDDADGLSKGDDGEVVNEKGVGAVGGGRRINVKSSDKAS